MIFRSNDGEKNCFSLVEKPQILFKSMIFFAMDNQAFMLPRNLALEIRYTRGTERKIEKYISKVASILHLTKTETWNLLQTANK